MRYVVLDPDSTDPTYGDVEAAVILEARDDDDLREQLTFRRGMPLDDALATDYELDRRDG